MNYIFQIMFYGNLFRALYNHIFSMTRVTLKISIKGICTKNLHLNNNSSILNFISRFTPT